MPLRASDSPDKNKYKKLAVAVVILLAAAGVLCWGYGRSQPQVVTAKTRKMYVYDIKTRQISVADAKASTLSEGLLHAHVFSTGSCDSEAERWVGYLERLTPEAQKVMDDANKSGHGVSREGIRAFAEGTQVCDPQTPDQWVSDASEEGVQLRTAARESRDDKAVVECFP